MTLRNGLLRFRYPLLGIVVCVAAFLGSSRDAAAQHYRFRVSEMDLQVHIQPDASASLEYRIVFRNQPRVHAIDIVDIGLPHNGYSISNMSASVDGVDLPTIRKSQYIDVGVEVPLGTYQIAPGKEGTFRFQATMPDMVYQDTTDKERASLQVIPTWFDPSLQVGTTRLRMAIHLPPGVTPEEITYQDEGTRYDEIVLFGEGDQKHAVVTWDRPDFRLSSANPKIGISFPKRTMNRVVTMTAWGLLVKAFSEHPEWQFMSGLAMSLVFLIVFLRFSHGTGWVLALLLLGGLIFLLYRSPILHLLAWLPMIGLFVWNEVTLSRRRRSYLPAIAEVEGGGIKRGLTAPQAAVLLELPLGKILSLVIFGMLKKGLVTMSSADPLTVEVAKPYRAPKRTRVVSASRAGVVVHNYEHQFLDRLMAKEGTPVQNVGFQEPMKNLVVATARRMKGFDLSDTVEYYQRIVKRAWQEAESIGELEQRSESVDRNFDWMMMDPTSGRRFETWSRDGYDYHPSWTHSHGPSTAGSSSTPSTPSSVPSTPSTSKTSFGEVAASFTGWAESTSNHLASAIEPGSLGISTPKGVVDLSGVDRATQSVFEALAEAASNIDAGGGGGGGGGCACACAGCACACACAGGGR